MPLSKNLFYPFLTDHMDAKDHHQGKQTNYKTSRKGEVKVLNYMGAPALDDIFLSEFLYSQCLQAHRYKVDKVNGEEGDHKNLLNWGPKGAFGSAGIPPKENPFLVA